MTELIDSNYHDIFCLNLVRPTKAVIMDMNSEAMVAGGTVFVTCLSWGSRPAAKIRWLLRDRPLLDVK